MTTHAQPTVKGAVIAIAIHRHTGRPLDQHLEEVCSLIGRHSTTYHRIQEVWCNYELSDRQDRHFHDKEDRLRARLSELAAEIDCGITFEGDPRSFTVRLWPLDDQWPVADREQSSNYIGADVT